MTFYEETDLRETPLGSIPKDWEIAELGDNLIRIETGKRAKGGALNKGNVASIGGEHIDDQGNVLWDEMKFIPEDFYGFLTQGKVNLGDILLVKDGATTGKVAVVKKLEYEKVAVNEHVFSLRSKADRLLDEFLFHFLFSRFGQIQIKTRFHGMIGGIIRDDLKAILIPLPPIREQQKIVEVFATVDLAIQKTNEILAETENLKKGLAQRLLTYGVGKSPTAWKVVKLREVASIRYGLGQPPKRDDDGVPMIRATNIKRGSIIEKDLLRVKRSTVPDSRNPYLQAGDVIVVRSGAYTGDIGLVSKKWEGAVAGYDLIVSPSSNLDSMFLTQYLLSTQAQAYFSQLKSRSAQHHLNSKQVSETPIPLPSLREQQQVASILSKVDENLELEKKDKAMLQFIKQGLMDLLLIGKVRVKVT